MTEPKRTKIFIGYSKEDEDSLALLKTHLRQLELAGVLDCWDESRTNPGQEWLPELQLALEEAKVAVLIISSHFLASKLANEVTLPILLPRAQIGGVSLLSVIVRPCLWESSPLSAFKPVNSLESARKPLTAHQREEALVETARAVSDAISQGGRALLDSKPIPLDAISTRKEPAAHSQRRQAARWAAAVAGLVLAICGSMLYERFSNQPRPRQIYSSPPGMVLITGGPSSSSFFIDITEVTNESFVDWLNQNQFPVKAQTVSLQGEELLQLFPDALGGIQLKETSQRYTSLPGHSKRPVVWVSWAGAQRYCQTKGKRLLTSREWITAAYGPADQRPYPWGEQPPDCRRAVFGRWDELACAHEQHGPAMVMSTPGDRTPEGVYDLGGNVAEWVADDDAKGHRFFGGDYSRSDTPLIDKTRRFSHLLDAKNQPAKYGMGSNVGFRCAQSLPVLPTAPLEKRP